MRKNDLIPAGLACLSVGDATYMATAAGNVEVNLDRGMLAQWQLIDKIDEDYPGSTSLELNAPGFAVGAATAIFRALGGY